MNHPKPTAAQQARYAGMTLTKGDLHFVEDLVRATADGLKEQLADVCTENTTLRGRIRLLEQQLGIKHTDHKQQPATEPAHIIATNADAQQLQDFMMPRSGGHGSGMRFTVSDSHDAA